jgi:hypothetical protein
MISVSPTRRDKDIQQRAVNDIQPELERITRWQGYHLSLDDNVGKLILTH